MIIMYVIFFFSDLVENFDEASKNEENWLCKDIHFTWMQPCFIVIALRLPVSQL